MNSTETTAANAAPTAQTGAKVPMIGKIGYAATDFASNLVWATVGAFLTYFYTDVFGISAAAVGTLFLVARVWDAINDPLMGIAIDKTRSKYGKSRPWFLWMAVPFALFTMLTFLTPNFSEGGKIAWAYFTYIFLGMIYTAINIPVTSILPSLTNDIHERTVMGTFRMLGAVVGAVLVNVLTRPLVQAFGGGSEQKGFLITMTIYGILGAALFIFAFFHVKENVQTKVKKQSVLESMRAIKGNLPWLLMLIVGFTGQLSNTMKSGTGLYFLKYNLGRPELQPVLGLMMFLVIPSLAVIPFVSKRVGKRNTMLIGSVIGLVGYIIMFLFGHISVPMLFVGNIISSLGLGMTALAFVMISDTVDYGEWKNGVRSEGFLAAAASFGGKLGTGVGGALLGWYLSAAKYVANAPQQTQSALFAIRSCYTLIPLALIIVNILLLLFYKLDPIMPKIQEDLKARREAEAAE